jgi:hypothetical protein
MSCLLDKIKNLEEELKPYIKAVNQTNEICNTIKKNEEVKKARRKMNSAWETMCKLEKYNAFIFGLNSPESREVSEAKVEYNKCEKELDQIYKTHGWYDANAALAEAEKVLRQMRLKGKEAIDTQIHRDFMNSAYPRRET